MNGNGNGQSVLRFSGTSVILHCIITSIIGQQDYGNWGRIKMKPIKNLPLCTPIKDWTPQQEIAYLQYEIKFLKELILLKEKEIEKWKKN